MASPRQKGYDRSNDTFWIPPAGCKADRDRETAMSQLDYGASYAVREARDRVSAFGRTDVLVVARRGLASLFDYSVLLIVLLWFFAHFGATYRHGTLDFHLPAFFQFVPHKFQFFIWYPRTGWLVYLGICVAYFTTSEWLLGWTPGKLLFGIRVVDFFGKRPSLVQALVRNVLRVVDGYPFLIPNLVGFILLWTNGRRQRCGDRAAGTLVVDSVSFHAARGRRNRLGPPLDPDPDQSAEGSHPGACETPESLPANGMGA